MRQILAMAVVQIETTNACVNTCSNCTRLVGHKKPFFMDWDTFTAAVDSMVQFPRMTGIMGGEPLLHPQFEAMCQYLHSKIPPDRCGLWSCFPPGKEHYREVIVETFGNIFLNDHSRNDVVHAPVLVSARELPLEDWQKWLLIDQCWVQQSWSAAINPMGAFFCEVAAALALVLDKPKTAWPVKPGWWTKTPHHFHEQMEEFCLLCGCAMPLKKRVSTEIKDDVSPGMLKLLQEAGSPKIARGDYELYSLGELGQDPRKVATYKQIPYRDRIAARYGLFLMINERQFQTPYLMKGWEPKNTGDIP